ncbi:MAG TPA: hypothetical protein VLB51_05245 [Methylomirabilota bacterium]|nr:hypothetical protein [Methylomirabilota bacterium]
MVSQLALLALFAVDAVSVSAVVPNTLEAYRPAQLTISGEGFDDSCRVLIGTPGRMVPVAHELLGATEIRVRLASGYGPTPARRQLVVECGPRRRSSPVAIRIVVAPGEDAVLPTPAPSSPDESPSPVEGSPPSVASLEPATVGAGLLFTLTVIGEGFADGAIVEVFANRNAGSSADPSYEMVRFPAELASDSVLLVDFDRGFAAAPRLRQLVVVNPDGAVSSPAYLRIQRSVP